MEQQGRNFGVTIAGRIIWKRASPLHPFQLATSGLLTYFIALRGEFVQLVLETSSLGVGGTLYSSRTNGSAGRYLGDGYITRKGSGNGRTDTHRLQNGTLSGWL